MTTPFCMRCPPSTRFALYFVRHINGCRVLETLYRMTCSLDAQPDICNNKQSNQTTFHTNTNANHCRKTHNHIISLLLALLFTIYTYIYIYIRSIDVAVVQMAPFPWCWSPSLCIRRNYLCLAPCLCIAQSEHRHRAKGATELKYKTALLQQHGTHWLWRWILVNTVRSWVGYGSILDVTVSVCVVGVHHLVMR